jgi:hypothetical protein
VAARHGKRRAPVAVPAREPAQTAAYRGKDSHARRRHPTPDLFPPELIQLSATPTEVLDTHLSGQGCPGHQHARREEGETGMPGRHAAPEPTLVQAVRRWQQLHPVPPLPAECIGGQAYPLPEPLSSPPQRSEARHCLDEHAER